MKWTLLFSIFFSCQLPLTCPADLLIYKGTAKTKIAGGYNRFNTHARIFWIHDTKNEVTTQIFYENRPGQKYYHISDVATRASKVRLLDGLSFTVFSQIKSETDTNGVLTSQSIWIRGKDRLLKISTSTTNSFPRTLTLQAKDLQIVYEPVIAETVGSGVFMSTETIAANDAGETVARVVARLSAYLESLGYIFNGSLQSR